MNNKKEIHYVYKIKNISPINTKQYYIDVHTTLKLPKDNGYIESSKYLNKAILNEGINNFSKEILSI